jgi:hypothetical protein
MIDHDLRKSLSQDVRRLITGRMTNDEFDEVYYDTYDSSDDQAVCAVASSCYCLYSDAFPYRLRGVHAVDRETRSTAARAVLFLRSCIEYEWPPMPGFHWLDVPHAFASTSGIPAGIVLSVLSIPLFLSEPYLVLGLLALLGIVLLVGSIALIVWHRRFVSERWKSFRAAGDYDVWPFLRRADFDQARTSCHMFAR